MKKVLITGTNSYIGTSFEKWCLQYPDKYLINSIDMRDGSWKKVSFEGYDTVFHVAGIAHVSKNPKLEQMYYKINRELAIETAKKAKKDGVKQFVFMSSIIVYGDCTCKVIDRNTVPKPENFYGKSKLQAEEGIQLLNDKGFHIAIIRPPMVYGKGCKGNYPRLSKLAKRLPVFPNIDNKRSMIHIDNLCEFIRLVIENEEKGKFFPQNKEYVKSSDLFKTIAELHGKKVCYIDFFNFAIKILSKHVNLFNKVFGDLVYEQEISRYKIDYWVRSLKESVEMTEQGNV